MQPEESQPRESTEVGAVPFDACRQWAFCSLTQSPGARAYYDRQRAKGKTHNQVLRSLANRLVGVLDGCLRHRQTYSETIAWGEVADLAA
jgi:hypothetical protein